jgi:hypothetical protein
LRASHLQHQHHCKTRNGAPTALRVSSIPALSIFQVPALLYRVDDDHCYRVSTLLSKRARDQSHSMHIRYIHMLYTHAAFTSDHACIQPSHQHTSHTSPISPQPAVACLLQPARAILSTMIMRHPQVRVSTKHHADALAQAQMTKPVVPTSSQKAKHSHSRQAGFARKK